MNSSEQILGELKEFKRSADKRFDRIEERIEKITWKVAGMASLVAIFLTQAINFLRSH